MKIFFNMLLKLFDHLQSVILINNYTISQQAASLALGAYVAFCPFIGFHTVMMIFFAWLLRLNGPLMIGFSCIINNPWTMVAVYFFGYWVGVHIVSLLGLQALPELSFMVHINNWLQTYFKTVGISGWAFLIGGNVVGVIIGLITYIAAYLLLKHYHKPLSRS